MSKEIHHLFLQAMLCSILREHRHNYWEQNILKSINPHDSYSCTLLNYQYFKNLIQHQRMKNHFRIKQKFHLKHKTLYDLKDLLINIKHALAYPKPFRHREKNWLDQNNDRKEHVLKFLYHSLNYHLKECGGIPFPFSFFYCLNLSDQFELKRQHQIPFQQKNEHLYLSVQKDLFTTRFQVLLRILSK